MYKTNNTKDTFMNHCTACGGNWTAMLFTGIKATNPELYAAMPNVSYDFITICELVNLICTDSKVSIDRLKNDFNPAFDVFTAEDHAYWTECLTKATRIIKDTEQAAVMAFLWMFKYLELKAEEVDSKQLRATCEYIAKYERWLWSNDSYVPYGGSTNLEIAKEYVYKTIDETYVDIDIDRVWNALLDNDDFVNEVNRSTSREEIEETCDYAIEEAFDDVGGPSGYSNRDPYYDFH